MESFYHHKEANDFTQLQRVLLVLYLQGFMVTYFYLEQQRIEYATGESAKYTETYIRLPCTY